MASAALVEVDVRAADFAPWHPGRCAEIVLAGEVIGMSPPFVISDEQIDRMVAVLDRAIARVGQELKAGV